MKASSHNPVRLACVRHAASVRPEPGSNSLMFVYQHRFRGIHIASQVLCLFQTLALARFLSGLREYSFAVSLPRSFLASSSAGVLFSESALPPLLPLSGLPLWPPLPPTLSRALLGTPTLSPADGFFASSLPRCLILKVLAVCSSAPPPLGRLPKALRYYTSFPLPMSRGFSANFSKKSLVLSGNSHCNVIGLPV